LLQQLLLLMLMLMLMQNFVLHWVVCRDNLPAGTVTDKYHTFSYLQHTAVQVLTFIP
jgi:hypothetical protein